MNKKLRDERIREIIESSFSGADATKTALEIKERRTFDVSRSAGIINGAV